MMNKLEDKDVLNSIPKSEKEKIREFEESYEKFRKSWDDYLEKIKIYRSSR